MLSAEIAGKASYVTHDEVEQPDSDEDDQERRDDDDVAEASEK